MQVINNSSHQKWNIQSKMISLGICMKRTHKSEAWNQNKNIDYTAASASVLVCSFPIHVHVHQRFYLTDDLSRLFINTRIQCVFMCIAHRVSNSLLHKLIEWHRVVRHVCFTSTSSSLFCSSYVREFCMGIKSKWVLCSNYTIFFSSRSLLQLIQLKSVEICVD